MSDLPGNANWVSTELGLDPKSPSPKPVMFGLFPPNHDGSKELNLLKIPYRQFQALLPMTI